MKKILITCVFAILVLLILYPQTALAQSEPENSDDNLWNRMGYETVDELMEWVCDALMDNSSSDMPFWQVWGAYSKDDFMKWNDIDAEGYQVLEEAWQRTREKVRAVQNLLRIDELDLLGGTPGIINVMYNGEFVKFTNAVPEMTGDSTFVPAKAFFETLGATVSYDVPTRVITAKFDDWSLEFAAGKDTISVTKNETKSVRPIALEPYTKKGVSYIPIRTVAEVLEFDVYWDVYFRTVVIIDLENIAAEINKDFTIVNSLLKMPMNLYPDGDTTYKSVFDILVSITQFDSMDGDTTTNIDANITVFTNGRNFSMTGEINLSNLLTMIFEEYTSYDIYDEDDEVTEMVKKLNEIQRVKAELIFNYDEGMLYIRVPVLSEFIPEITKGAWISISGFDKYDIFSRPSSILEGLGLEEYYESISIGTMIVSDSYYNQYSNQVHLYDELMDSAGLMKTLLGDEKFVKNSEGYTLELTLEELLAASEQFDEDIYADEFELKINIKIKDGKITGVSGGFVYREAMDSMYYSNNIMRYTCKFDINMEKIYFSLEVHERNSQKVQIEIKSESVKTSTPVPSKPPKGDKVIPIEELISIGDIDDKYLPDSIEQL